MKGLTTAMEQLYLCKDYFDNNETIHAGFYMQPRDMHMHSHEFWEIAYIYEGEGIHHTSGGNSTPVKEGTLILVSPGVSHCITSPPEKKGCWVRVINILIRKEKMKEQLLQLSALHEFDEFALRKLLFQNKPLLFQMKTNAQNIYNLFMVIAHESKHLWHGSELILETSTLNLLLLILRQYEQSITMDNVTTTKQDVIDTLIKYIHSNYSGPITLDFLAAYVHLSPEYLSRLFKKSTGKNLSVYLTEVRIDHAKYMLRTSHLPISEISLYCGFKSISNFQKSFKRFAGMNAGQYREHSISENEKSVQKNNYSVTL